jgi:hypothetical protein
MITIQHSSGTVAQGWIRLDGAGSNDPHFAGMRLSPP